MDLHFNKGLLGLEQYNDFNLKDIEENEFFKLLESKDDSNLSLAVLSPFEVEEDYTFELNEQTIDDLKIESESDILVFTTVTINSDMRKTTTNLRAPIIINTKNSLAEQIILNDEKYQIKHPIIKEWNKCS